MDKIIAQIHQKFVARGSTLGFAESCTGGLVSSIITAHAGASAYYRGTVVSYSAEVKMNILNVPKSLIQVMGEVSLPVAKVMAQGARQALKCDWGVAITGIAGPSGGSVEKPVGTVCFAIIGPGFELIEQKLIEGKGRVEIQRKTAEYALQLLHQGIHS